MSGVKWVENKTQKGECRELDIMSEANVAKARAFHESFPQYAPTPLVNLKELAKLYGVGALCVKDESFRFGLNAFKALGCSFAMARYISKATGRPPEALTYGVLTSPGLKKETGELTFFSATDGNHGRGVAWAARVLGHKAVIMMPAGSCRSRFENIKKEGAAVSIEELNYDDCVRKAAKAAESARGGVVMQDTAWDGYEEIPSWIMQGYGTMASEADEQFTKETGASPTHVFIQAGVGSLAGAVTGYFANKYGDRAPRVAVVEASAADCLYRSAKSGDGRARNVSGDLKTIMAGLACGEANPVSWNILKNNAAFFISLDDTVAARGMRVLGAPLPNDPRVISGESGAAAAGFLHALMTDGDLAPLRDILDVRENSRVLLFSTEGATDPDNYERIVWEGAYPKE